MTEPVAVRMLLGDYPVTLALKKGEVKSSAVSLDFADVKTPSSAFKRVVRDLEFDCAELGVFTSAKSRLTADDFTSPFFSARVTG